ncbi:MAG: UDP-N-acetylmuramoyl-tripeptide--D-alanyl-D-alanine ligase [Lachnospiraceae bacterium]|nr:UDP-N-acetylmuramoyl-tripeptide--D-alanyl-D-alanine ligase [Lachnospiraceae bacterium]
MTGLTIEKMAEVCHGEIFPGKKTAETAGAEKREARCVVIDSWKIQPDGVFIATRGERVDGHSFIPQVFDAGALAVICEKVPEDVPGCCIRVEDSFRALTELAAYYRTQLTAKIIGVTGSVGKTTTKEQIASVLRKKYKVCATEGNFNNEIGVPLTLLRIQPEDEMAVVEMGINHFGEMSRLTRLVQPDMAVITAIGECHLEALGDLDGVLRAKSEIFESMEDDAPVFLNRDDPKLRTVQRKNIIPFGGECPAAEAVGKYLGLTEEQIREGLEEIKPLPGRGRRIDCGSFTIIDDCYNANPSSMRYSIDRLLRLAPAGRVCILGDMFELGSGEAELHASVGTYAGKAGVERLITVGKLSERMAEAYTSETGIAAEHYGSTEELLRALKTLDFTGKTILVKASHGMHFEKVVEEMQSGL